MSRRSLLGVLLLATATLAGIAGIVGYTLGMQDRQRVAGEGQPPATVGRKGESDRLDVAESFEESAAAQRAEARERRQPELSAEVVFENDLFTISSGDTFDWYNVRMQLDARELGQVKQFNFEVERFPALRTYRVPASRFVRATGGKTTLGSNPFQCVRFTISCWTPQGNRNWTRAWGESP